MYEPAKQGHAGERRVTRLGHQTAYALVALLLLFIVVMLPFALTSVVTDVTEQADTVYRLAAWSDPPPAVRSDVHLEIIEVNEWEGTASIRVSVHQSCHRDCPWGDRYLLVSVYGNTDDRDTARPTSQYVTLPATTRDVSEVIALPLFGDPIRYPFDRYRLGIGIILDRLLPDGSVETVTPEEAQGYLSVTLQARTPALTMHAPVRLDPATVQDGDEIDPYLVVDLLRFERPLYVKVLTVLLILLVTAAAAYALFLRPINELIINAGGLVLGVWGIRAILLGTAVPGVTAVDLSLSVVILFLLLTITVRTLWVLDERSGLHLLRRIGAGAPAETKATPDWVPEPAERTPPAAGRAREGGGPR